MRAAVRTTPGSEITKIKELSSDDGKIIKMKPGRATKIEGMANEWGGEFELEKGSVNFQLINS